MTSYDKLENIFLCLVTRFFAGNKKFCKVHIPAQCVKKLLYSPNNMKSISFQNKNLIKLYNSLKNIMFYSSNILQDNTYYISLFEKAKSW